MTDKPIPHEIRPTRAYLLGSQIVVPHYSKPGVFVMPGGKEFDETYFRAFGAIPIMAHLWPR